MADDTKDSVFNKGDPVTYEGQEVGTILQVTPTPRGIEVLASVKKETAKILCESSMEATSEVDIHINYHHVTDGFIYAEILFNGVPRGSLDLPLDEWRAFRNSFRKSDFHKVLFYFKGSQK